MLADGLDVLCGRGDVAALTARAVLNEDKIAERKSVEKGMVVGV